MRATLKQAAFAALAAAPLLTGAAAANTDPSGVHGFVNDDRNQFVDMWYNGNITVKVSNGRPWRPMWVVVHATFRSGDGVIAKRDYHVYCPSPTPGGHGNEQWFAFSGSGLAGITSIQLDSNKEGPWRAPPPGEQQIPLGSVSIPSP